MFDERQKLFWKLTNDHTTAIGIADLSEEAIYKGEFKNGVPDGVGTLYYSNGAIYRGEFREGQKGPFGEFIYEDKSVFRGEFKNDLRNGRGILFCGSYSIMGYWQNDVLHGNACVFKGERNVLLHEFPLASESTHHMVFENGRMVESARLKMIL